MPGSAQERPQGRALPLSRWGADLCCGQVGQSPAVLQRAPEDSYLRDPLPGSVGSSGLVRLFRDPLAQSAGGACGGGLRLSWPTRTSGQWSVLSI